MIKWKNRFIYLLIVAITGFLFMLYGYLQIRKCYYSNNKKGYLFLFTGIYLVLLSLGLLMLQNMELKFVLVFIFMIIITLLIMSCLLNNKKEHFGAGNCEVGSMFGYSLGGNTCIINNKTMRIPSNKNKNKDYGVGSCLTSDNKFGYRLPFYKNKCISTTDINNKINNHKVDGKNKDNSDLNNFIKTLLDKKKIEEDRLNRLEQEKQHKYYTKYCKTIPELETECSNKNMGLYKANKCPPSFKNKHISPQCKKGYSNGIKIPDNSTKCISNSIININKNTPCVNEFGMYSGAKNIDSSTCPQNQSRIECSTYYDNLENKKPYSKCVPVGNDPYDACKDINMNYTPNTDRRYDCPSNTYRFKCNY